MHQGASEHPLEDMIPITDTAKETYVCFYLVNFDLHIPEESSNNVNHFEKTFNLSHNVQEESLLPLGIPDAVYPALNSFTLFYD